MRLLPLHFEIDQSSRPGLLLQLVAIARDREHDLFWMTDLWFRPCPHDEEGRFSPPGECDLPTQKQNAKCQAMVMIAQEPALSCTSLPMCATRSNGISR